MREAVIVSTARTPIGKAYRGAFNSTTAQALGGHAIKHAVARAGVDPAEVEDVVMGAAIHQGTAFQNVARQALIHAGLPETVSGQTIDRQCSSGMMAISIAAKQIITDGQDVAIGGGVESISMNQTGSMFATPAQAFVRASRRSLAKAVGAPLAGCGARGGSRSRRGSLEDFRFWPMGLEARSNAGTTLVHPSCSVHQKNLYRGCTGIDASQ